MAIVPKTRTKSFRLDPALVAEAQRATGAKDETEAVRIAHQELLERARFRKWVRNVAGKGTFPGHDG
jgi:Arc/MetJ family transcription regulator